MGKSKLTWNDLGNFDILEAGHQLNKTELLFEQISDEEIEKQLEKLEKTKEENKKLEFKPNPIKEILSFEDFQKIDIRVGTVLNCIKVPKADKLLQFKIDDGAEGRIIISGIAQSYPNPQELIGKQICFIANFAPRKLKGINSEGMLLSAENSDGKLVLIEPQKIISNGASIG